MRLHCSGLRGMRSRPAVANRGVAVATRRARLARSSLTSTRHAHHVVAASCESMRRLPERLQQRCLRPARASQNLTEGACSFHHPGPTMRCVGLSLAVVRNSSSGGSSHLLRLRSSAKASDAPDGHGLRVESAGAPRPPKSPPIQKKKPAENPSSSRSYHRLSRRPWENAQSHFSCPFRIALLHL